MALRPDCQGADSPLSVSESLDHLCAPEPGFSETAIPPGASHYGRNGFAESARSLGDAQTIQPLTGTVGAIHIPGTEGASYFPAVAIQADTKETWLASLLPRAVAFLGAGDPGGHQGNLGGSFRPFAST